MLKNAIWIFVITLVVLFFFLPSYTRMQDLRQKNEDFQSLIDKLQLENARLREEKRRLEDDPAYLEGVGREKMGIVRDGEVIYKIEPLPTEE